MLFIFILFCLGNNQCWFISIFGLIVIIIYQLMNYDNQSDIILGQSQPWYPNLSFHAIFDPNRDAQLEGRTAHPTDANIIFFIGVENDEPLSIEDTQPHDLPILVDLNNIQRRDVFVINENDTVNEDATFYENVNHNIIVLATQNGESQRSIIAESSAVVMQNNIRSNQTNSINEQPIPSASVEEIQRHVVTQNTGVHQTTIAVTCSTSIRAPEHRTPMDSSTDLEEESAT